ncbi:MAG: glycosyltransferase family 4 protein [Candidatus Saccharibacteria bacterium]
MKKPAPKKRILIVGQHFWPETFRITDIAEGFVEQGFDVDVLCGTPNYPSGKFFPGYSFFKNRRQDYRGVNIIRVPEIPRGNNTNFRILINYLSFPFFSLFYVPYLLTKKYDRVMVYQLSPVMMSIPGILVAKIKGIKLYMYICDFWPHSLFSILHFKNKYLVKFITWFSYWHYRRADGLVGVFKGIQTRLISEVGIDKQRTLYIPQVAEKLYENEVFDKVLEKRFKGTFNIVFAGAINPAQSFDTVVEAAMSVINSGHTNVKFIIIGDGMSRKWLEEEVAKLGIVKYFAFEGFKPVADIPKYQTIADALLVALTKSSLFEYGIPAKVQSYMASGRPIVGAMDGEGQRLINNSKCGICVDSGDAQGLADAITKMVTMKPKDRLQMGKNGRTYHFEHFEREYNLHRLIEFVVNDNRIVDTEFPD